MRIETCNLCPHLSAGICEHRQKPISKIKGCSICPSGRKFFKARQGKEAVRLRIANRKGENK